MNLLEILPKSIVNEFKFRDVQLLYHVRQKYYVIEIDRHIANIVDHSELGENFTGIHDDYFYENGLNLGSIVYIGRSLNVWWILTKIDDNFGYYISHDSYVNELYKIRMYIKDIVGIDYLTVFKKHSIISFNKYLTDMNEIHIDSEIIKVVDIFGLTKDHFIASSDSLAGNPPANSIILEYPDHVIDHDHEYDGMFNFYAHTPGNLNILNVMDDEASIIVVTEQKIFRYAHDMIDEIFTLNSDSDQIKSYDIETGSVVTENGQLYLCSYNMTYAKIQEFYDFEFLGLDHFPLIDSIIAFYNGNGGYSGFLKSKDGETLELRYYNTISVEVVNLKAIYDAYLYLTYNNELIKVNDHSSRSNDFNNYVKIEGIIDYSPQLKLLVTIDGKVIGKDIDSDIKYHIREIHSNETGDEHHDLMYGQLPLDYKIKSTEKIYEEHRFYN